METLSYIDAYTQQKHHLYVQIVVEDLHHEEMLLTHLLTHSGEKRFECEFFFDLSLLSSVTACAIKTKYHTSMCSALYMTSFH